MNREKRRTQRQQPLLMLQPVAQRAVLVAARHARAARGGRQRGQLVQARAPGALAHRHHLVAQRPRHACAPSTHMLGFDGLHFMVTCLKGIVG